MMQTAILVLYHSQEYGNTAQMAEAVAEGARAAGAEVTLHNANDSRFDVANYAQFDAVAFGTPDYYSYFAGTLKTFLDDWYITKKGGTLGMTGKPYALFYSHGGGGAAKAPFEEEFERIGFKVGMTISSRGRPDDATKEACRALGKQLVESVG